MGVIIPVGFGIAKLRWKIITAPDEQITTFGYANNGTNSAQADADAIWTAFQASGRPGNPANYSTKYHCKGTEVTLMTGTGPIGAEHTVTIIGTGTGTPLTSNTAVLLKKVTARGGRKGRGRMFIPGIGVSEIDVDESGIIGVTQIGILQGIWAAFFAALPAQGILPVLLHSDGGAPDSITSVNIEGTVATQRRRMRRG